MFRNVIEYKTCGDLLGAVKQALRRFTPNGTCLIKIEEISLENKVIEENLLITDGNIAIRISEIPNEELTKLKTIFNQIAIPYVYQNNKWVSILEDVDYVECIIVRIENLLKEN